MLELWIHTFVYSEHNRSVKTNFVSSTGRKAVHKNIGLHLCV